MKQTIYFLFNGFPIAPSLKENLRDNRKLPLAENLFLRLGQKEALTNFSQKSEEHRVVAIKSDISPS